jgi:hypothetical protein
MPVIDAILSRLGKNTVLLKIDNDRPFVELIDRYCKYNCIRKNERSKLKFTINGTEILSYEAKISQLSQKNPTEIKVTSDNESNMETGRDNWRDGIIQGRGWFSFVSEEERRFIFTSLREKVSKKIRNKLYSATEDGDTANNYHERCDNKGPLFYLIQTTEDKIFGIYLSQSVSSEGVTKSDSLQMVICPYRNFAILSNNNNSTYHCYADKGALFHCMQINAPFLSSNCVDIQSCDNFYNESQLPCYPSGNRNYKIKELEVYSLENSN